MREKKGGARVFVCMWGGGVTEEQLLLYYRLVCPFLTQAFRIASIYIHDILCASLPRTEEIEIKTFTTPKISNKFSWESPYTLNTFSREASRFPTGFCLSKRSVRHSKDLSGKLIDLEIQIIKSDLLREWSLAPSLALTLAATPSFKALSHL